MSGSSFRKRSWSFAQVSQWSCLFHCLLGIGFSHKWHSTNLGPQQKARKQERKNQKAITPLNTIIHVCIGSSKSCQESLGDSAAGKVEKSALNTGNVACSPNTVPDCKMQSQTLNFLVTWIVHFLRYLHNSPQEFHNKSCCSCCSSYSWKQHSQLFIAQGNLPNHSVALLAASSYAFGLGRQAED